MEEFSSEFRVSLPAAGREFGVPIDMQEMKLKLADAPKLTH
jgi:hypothetical protein